ncbi:MAG: hypothetical protein ACO1QB_07985, partial [Verrucomicrobiales bacterium]
MIRFFALILVGLATTLGGCAKPPEPLTVEEIPPRMAAVFETAKFHIKKTSDAIIVLVKARQWPGASMQLQALLSNTTLTQEQRDTASRALMAVNLLIQEQAETVQPEPTDSTTEANPRLPVAPSATPEEAAAAAAGR